MKADILEPSVVPARKPGPSRESKDGKAGQGTDPWCAEVTGNIYSI
jgi:hypothetical protein